MAHFVIVVDKESDFSTEDPDSIVLTAREFISSGPSGLPRRRRVVNLCHDVRYLSLGYYCSLLAEARGVPVIPAADILLELGWKRLYEKALPELNEMLRRVEKEAGLPEDITSFRCFFGAAEDPRFTKMAVQLNEHFGCPILEVQIRRRPRLEIQTISPLSVRDLKGTERAIFEGFFAAYRKRRKSPRKPSPTLRHRLAVLCDPKEEFPPSNAAALRKLIRVGASLGMQVELITRKDYGRLAEFEGLFIRETTGLDHHTYRFARKAESLGLAVIDDPTSILRCANKIYLAELFEKYHIPTPRTMILDRNRLGTLERNFAFPIILKIPDGSFSRGVFKAASTAQLKQIAATLFKRSDLILAQEFLYTAFDWRIGILNHTPVFACQYFMADKHWQILKHKQDGNVSEGQFRAWRCDEAPPKVIDAALRATAPIGEGFYGVDIKESETGVFVIEVNDNPNIYARFEDRIARDGLYEALIGEFLRRIEGCK